MLVDGNFGVLMGVETVAPRTDVSSAGLVVGQVIRRRFTNIWKKEGTRGGCTGAMRTS